MSIESMIIQAGNNNVLVYDSSTNDSLTSRLIYLMRVVMKETYTDTVKTWYTNSHDLNQKVSEIVVVEDQHLGQLWLKNNNTVQGDKLSANIILAVGEKGTLLAGCY